MGWKEDEERRKRLAGYMPQQYNWDTSGNYGKDVPISLPISSPSPEITMPIASTASFATRKALNLTPITQGVSQPSISSTSMPGSNIDYWEKGMSKTATNQNKPTGDVKELNLKTTLNVLNKGIAQADKLPSLALDAVMWPGRQLAKAVMGDKYKPDALERAQQKYENYYDRRAEQYVPKQEEQNWNLGERIFYGVTGSVPTMVLGGALGKAVGAIGSAEKTTAALFPKMVQGKEGLENVAQVGQQLKGMIPFGSAAGFQAEEQASKEFTETNTSQWQETGHGKGSATFNEQAPQLSPLQKAAIFASNAYFETTSELAFLPEWFNKMIGAGGTEIIEAGSQAAAKSFGKRFIDYASKHFGMDLLKEGAQEAIVDPPENAAAKAIYKPEMKMFGKDAVVDPQQMGEDYLGGMLMSVMMSGFGLSEGSVGKKVVEDAVENDRPFTVEDAKVVTQDMEQQMSQQTPVTKTIAIVPGLGQVELVGKPTPNTTNIMDAAGNISEVNDALLKNANIQQVQVSQPQLANNEAAPEAVTPPARMSDEQLTQAKTQLQTIEDSMKAHPERIQKRKWDKKAEALKQQIAQEEELRTQEAVTNMQAAKANYEGDKIDFETYTKQIAQDNAKIDIPEEDAVKNATEGITATEDTIGTNTQETKNTSISETLMSKEGQSAWNKIAESVKKDNPNAKLSLVRSKSGFQRHISKIMKSQFGTEVVFYKGDSNVNGFVDPRVSNTIFIKVSDDRNEMMQTTAHEFLHIIAKRHAEDYKALLEFGQTHFGAEAIAKYQEAFKDKPTLYARHKADMNLTIEEMLADELGNNFTNHSFWDNLYNHSKELFEKVVKIAKGMIDEINKYGSYAAKNTSEWKTVTYVGEETAKALSKEFEKTIASVRQQVAEGKVDTEAKIVDSLYDRKDGKTREKYNGDALTPLEDIIKFALKKEQWKADQSTPEFGSVNNRMLKELEVSERLFGKIPDSYTANMPGKLEGNTRPLVRTITPSSLGKFIYDMIQKGEGKFLMEAPIEEIVKKRGVTDKEAKLLRDDLKSIRGNQPILSDNGKAGKSIDFLLGTCHPTRPCKECYAASAYIRMSAVRKAMRNTIRVYMDPFKFGKEAAKEVKKVDKFKLPFVRLLGSGDLTSDEQVDAFNTLAENLDRPIHIFSRHHDMLGRLISRPNAPFIKMGSIDIQLYEVYGVDYLADNLKDRGIANVFLYTSPTEFNALKSLKDRDAVKLILSANHELHDTLDKDKEMQASSCPCDAGERSYMHSCVQCAMSDMGCFMSFSTMGVDTNGKVWDYMDEEAPEELTPIAVFGNESESRSKAYAKVAVSVIKKSVELINLYERAFKKGERSTIPLKDIRFNGEDSVSYVDNIEAAEWYKGKLKEMINAAAKGSFYLPGGEIQPEVYFEKGRRVTNAEKVATARENARIKVNSTVQGEDVADDMGISYSAREKEKAVYPNEEKGLWKRGASFDEIKAQFPELFGDSELADQEKRHPTQVTNTVNTYKKIFQYLLDKGFTGSILDASSGLGLGTKAGKEMGLDIEDLEPYPDKDYHPMYTKYSDVTKKYDIVISSAVLNVIPQDLRDGVTVDLGRFLKPNGEAFILTRGKDVENAKSKIAIPTDTMAYYIPEKKSYQKGFTPNELKAYVEDMLGTGYTVETVNPNNSPFDKGREAVIAYNRPRTAEAPEPAMPKVKKAAKPKNKKPSVPKAPKIIGGREVLKTLNGSAVARSKYGVGKKMMDKFYVHKNYATDIVPKDIYEKALKIFENSDKYYEFNAVAYNPKTQAVRFDEAPNFDTAREPIPERQTTVMPDGSIKFGGNKQIWHHKWQWVKDDYKGFNVDESYNWSKEWLSKVPETANGWQHKWNAQLDDVGLPHDESIKYSVGSDKFKAWFKDSKVVNEDGSPMVVYHGTRAIKDFNVFETKRNIDEPGTHFGTQEAAADFVDPDYSTATGDRVYPVYLSIQHPLTTEDLYGDAEEVFFGIRHMIDQKELKQTPEWANVISAHRLYKQFDASKQTTTQLRDALVNYLKGLGYDGLKYTNNMEDVGSTSWVAFDPNQIKSAIGNNGEYASDNPDIRYNAGSKEKEVQPTFYSKLQQTIQKKMANAAAPNAIMSLLRNNGVKEEEITWSGIEDFLDGQDKVSKAELMDFLKGNELQLREIEKQDITEDPDYMYPVVADAIRTKLENNDETSPELYRLIKKWVNERTDEAEYELKTALLFKSSVDFQDTWDEVADSGDGVRYKEYASKGGKHYREKLMIFPDRTDDNYQSDHWDEENVLAHTRLQDYTDHEGNKILRIEEIQSDWHQAGRKQGYTEPGTRERLEKEYTDLRRQIKAYDRQIDDAYDSNDKELAHKLEDEKFELEKQIRKNQENRELLSEQVPDAPFKKSWPEFVFKRVLREAVEKGYDKIQWAGGKENADRYQLSKQIKKINWYAYDDGTYTLYFTDNRGKSFAQQSEYIKPNQMEDLIGKELTDRIVEKSSTNTKGTLEGLDLEVGGEGMKGFYDKILPDFVKKYVKKWGAEVTRTPEDRWEVNITDAMRDEVLYQGQTLYSARKKNKELRPEEYDSVTPKKVWDESYSEVSRNLESYRKKLSNTGKLIKTKDAADAEAAVFALRQQANGKDLIESDKLHTEIARIGELIDSYYAGRGHMISDGMMMKMLGAESMVKYLRTKINSQRTESQDLRLIDVMNKIDSILENTDTEEEARDSIRQYMNKTFKGRMNKAQETWINSITESVYRGDLEDDELKAAFAAKWKIPSFTDKNAAVIIATAEKLDGLEKGSDEYNILANELNDYMNSLKKHTFWEHYGTWEHMMMLSAPKSAIRNITGNMARIKDYYIEEFGKALMDMVQTNVRKYALGQKDAQRSTLMPKPLKIFTGIGQGAFREVRDVITGKDTSDVEDTRDFASYIKYKNPFGRVIQGYVKLLMTDRPFKQVVLDDQIARAEKLAKKYNVEFNRVEAMQIANEIADETFFNGSDEAIQWIQKARKDLNALPSNLYMRHIKGDKEYSSPGHYGLGNWILAFAKVPYNISKFAVEREYHLAAGKIILRAAHTAYAKASKSENGGGYINKDKTFNTKAFINDLSKLGNGLLIMYLGSWLYQMGLVNARPDDDDKDKKFLKLEKLLGHNKFQLNLSAMRRFFLEGKRVKQEDLPTDTHATLDWFVPTSILLIAGIKGQELNDKKVKEAGDEHTAWYMKLVNDAASKMAGLFEGTMNQVNGVVEMPMFQTVQKLMGAKDPTEFLATLVLDIPSRMIPAPLKYVKDSNDNTQRDTYATTTKDKWLNGLKVKMPGIEKSLPPKVDMFGEDIKNYPTGNGVFNVWFNPASMSKYTDSPEAQKFRDIYEKFGTKDHIPADPRREIPITKEEYPALTEKKQTIILTPEEFYQYSVEYGKKVKEIAKGLSVKSDADEQHIEDLRITRLYDKARDEIEKKILKARGLNSNK